MQNRISLAIIIKPSDLEMAKTAINSVGNNVDEVCLTVTGPLPKEAVIPDYVKVSYFDWIDDFSAARTFNFQQCTGDWILWLDADDLLSKAHNLRQIVATAEEKGISGLGFLYKYEFDDQGNCIDEHWKVQLVKNDGHFEWRGAIHEDLAQLRAVTWSKTQDVVRVHQSNHKRAADSFERNLRILTKEVAKNPNEPRTWFYLGRTYVASGQFQEAVVTLGRYLELSGWDEERYEASLLIGQCYVQTGQDDEALKWYNQALLEKEEYPDAYIYKGLLYLKSENYGSAITNFEIALGRKRPPANTFYNPMLYARELPSALAVAYLHTGKFKEALQYAQYAKNEQVVRMAQEIIGKFETSKKYSEIVEYLEANGRKNLIQPLISSVPADLTDNPLILSVKRRYFPPKKWPKNSLVVFCGTAAENWDAETAKVKGIGGSETAVIEITERLKDKGWEITVFNNCNAPAEGKVINGVTYRNYWEFNPDDEFDALWVWRMPDVFDYDIKGRIRILDLHDVMNPLEFTDKRLERMDKIFVKTNYHRSLLPKVPDDKFEIIGNGIDLNRFRNTLANIKEVDVKEPYRFIYSSTPNRGLDILLEYMWDDIRKEFPKAELHVYYGWNTFHALEKHNPERMAWMKKVQKLMEKPGVINHGRVDQKTLAEHQIRSSFWLYPTYFPEIHCITACEMQAAGVIPITSGYAALAETVKNGITVEGDVYDPEYHKRFVAEVIKAVKQDNRAFRRKMSADANQFSWDIVADYWHKKLCE